jgi:hypothetical protein
MADPTGPVGTPGVSERRGRDSYAEVGTAMRAAVAKAHAADLGERDLRVFEAVLILTASWSKLSDKTSTRQVAALAYAVPHEDVHAQQRRRAGKSLRKLARLGVIGYAPGRGHWARCTVSLPLVDNPLSMGVATDPIEEGEPSNGGRHRRPRGSLVKSKGVAGVSYPSTYPRSTPSEQERTEENKKPDCPDHGPGACFFQFGTGWVHITEESA